VSYRYFEKPILDLKERYFPLLAESKLDGIGPVDAVSNVPKPARWF